jgi:hypothetical protein
MNISSACNQKIIFEEIIIRYYNDNKKMKWEEEGFYYKFLLI